MSWWWDNVIDPQDWYFHFGPVASIVDGIAFDREGFRSGGAMAEAPGQDLRAYSLIGETAALVWVKNAAHQWYAPDRAQIEDATLTVGIPSSGKWVATWLDTYTGRITQSRELDVRIGLGLPGGDKLPARKLLDIPPFSRDIALRLDRSDQQRVLP